MAQPQLLFAESAPAQSRELRLLSLRLRNFKGIRDLTIDAQGRSLEILGDNAVGKTTTFDAYSWLLFDKDSQNRKEFDLKTLDADGQPEHGLEHEVEGVFDLDGETLTLRKVYSEKWVKQRGSAERVFSGHETAYFIDGVPVKKQQYEARVSSIAEDRVFRLLCDPNYFNTQLHWQQRRRLLLDVCGDISEHEIIESDPALQPLKNILGRRSLDDHRKVLAAAKAKINRELEQIPVRISEVQRGLPDVEGLDADAATNQLEEARSQRKMLLEQLVQAEQGGGVAQKRQRVSEISAHRLDIESSYRRKAEDAWAERRQKAQDAELAVRSAERELAAAKDALRDTEEFSKRLDGRLHELRSRYSAIAEEEFSYTDETQCPTCGQPLPEEMVEEARAKAREQWNLAHAERLEQINHEGRETRNRKDRADAAAEEHRRNIKDLETRLDGLRKSASKAAAEAAKPEAASGLDKDPEYIRLGVERDALMLEIERLKAGGQAKTADLRAEIAELDSAIALAEKTISQVEQHARGTARIEELKAEEQRLAAEYEDIERQLYLTEEFIRAKVRLLTDRINSRFVLARFKLFDTQVNGAISECCDTTYQGVPWNSLNHGAQINVGLDIIRTLSEHFGFRAPVWIDRRESVTRLIDLPCQVVSLTVSAKDKTLRIVKEAS